jgi:hypothetical protein
MVALNRTLIIECGKLEEYLIEKYVEELSKNLFINETYFGNILTSLTVFYNLVFIDKGCKHLVINYDTDYKVVSISIKGANEKIVEKLIKKIDLNTSEMNEEEKNLFLIQSLTDEIKYNRKSGKLTFVYDISALHDKIYNDRKS